MCPALDTGFWFAEAVTGVPVAEMKDDYTKATFALTVALEKYLSLDPYDKERIKVIQVLLDSCCLRLVRLRAWHELDQQNVIRVPLPAGAGDSGPTYSNEFPSISRKVLTA